jgi:beta-lactam-binding protein with PASTA domain/serine/threonine protein kinase
VTDHSTPRERDEGGDPADLVGTLFAARYRLTGLLSAGANTVIYDGDDMVSGRRVTLKILRPSLDVSPQFVERFDRTIQAVAALSHPNIAAVYDWGPAPFEGVTTLFVAVEQLNGGSLRDLFDRGRRLTPSQALVVGLDACRALDHAHRRGIVHGELNPSKLVFGGDRRLRIVDLGLAAIMSEETWREPATVATHVARYASPEQALSLPIDGKTDVYALCLTLVEAVTGDLPFAADSTVATLSGRVGRLMPVSADLGPLAAVLSGAGRPDPEDRSTAAEFGRALLQAAEKLPRPEPIPLLSTGLFDVPLEQLRTPDDPTGGVTRPAVPPRPDERDDVGTDDFLLVPLDEPSVEPVSAAPGAPPAGSPGPSPVLAAATVDEVGGLPAPHPGEPMTILPAEAVEAGDGPITADDPHDADDIDDTVDTVPVDVPTTEHPEPLARDAIGDTDADIQDDTATDTYTDTDTDTDTYIDEPVITDERRPRRRFPSRVVVPIVVSIVVVLALGALGVVAWRLFSTPSYEVPDLVGLDEAAALEQIEGNDWVVTVTSERNDDEPDAGQVIRTVPAAGAELAEDEPFLLVVSEGPTLRVLPDVTGLPLAEAQTRLVELGLVTAVSEQHDEVVPAGTVVSWTVTDAPGVAAGAEVLPGTEVAVVTSLGPAPRTVPDLTGLTLADAQAAVAPLVLGLTEGEQLFSDTVPAGHVISQTPAPGEQVPRETTITVQLSRGPDVVTIPDLTGLACTDAGAALQAAGFAWTLAFGASDGIFQSATVGGQPAGAGGVYPRGTQVDVTCL